MTSACQVELQIYKHKRPGFTFLEGIVRILGAGYSLVLGWSSHFQGTVLVTGERDCLPSSKGHLCSEILPCAQFYIFQTSWRTPRE